MMLTKKRPVILTVSSANIDLTANMPYIPSAGQTLKSNYGYSITPGGKGANAAFAVSSFQFQLLTICKQFTGTFFIQALFPFLYLD